MNQLPLLDRTTLGQPNYRLIALASAFVLALVPLAAWREIEGGAGRRTASFSAATATRQSDIIGVGLTACVASAGVLYWRLRSARLMAIVVATGLACAAASLAIVFYSGAYEVLILGHEQPHWAVLNAPLISMPAIAYVVGIAGAVRLVRSFVDARRAGYGRRAAGRTLSMSWGPRLTAAAVTALGLAALCTSKLLPVQQFGFFTAASTVVAATIALAIAPLILHRFPPGDVELDRILAGRWGRASRQPSNPSRVIATKRPGLVFAVGLTLLLVADWKVGTWESSSVIVWGEALVAGGAVVLMWDVQGGLAAAAAIGLSLSTAIGAFGGLGIRGDLSMLTAVAVGLAVSAELAVQFVMEFRRGLALGLDRRSAARQSSERTSPGALDVALVGGAAFSVVAVSQLAALQPWCWMAVGLCLAALVSNLAFLPAMMAGDFSEIGRGLNRLRASRQRLAHAFARRARPSSTTLSASAKAAEPSAKRSRIRTDPGEQGVPAIGRRGAVTAQERQDVAGGPHSALHAKLQRLKRGPSSDSLPA